MSWFEAVPAFVAALGLLFLPGALLAWALRLGLPAIVGLAPLFSLGLAGTAAIAAAWVRVGWSVGVLLAATLAVSAGAWLLCRRNQAPGSLSDSRTVLLSAAAGTIAGTLFIGRRVTQLIGAPDNISQRYDNVFHLNAVRYVLDTANASTMDLGRMGGGGGGRSAVYPAVWHSFAALVTQVTGVEVPVSVNVVNVLACAVLWPVSVVFLTRVVLGPRPLGLAAAGVISSGFVAFPYLLMVWGPLFPNLMSVSVLPAGLAVVVMVCRRAAAMPFTALQAWFALAVALAGLALTHMSAINALIAFSAPLLLWTLAGRVRKLVSSKAPMRAYVITGLASLIGVVIAAAAWKFLRPGFYGGWTPHQTVAGAIGEVATNAPMGTDVLVVSSLLAALGAGAFVRRRAFWWFLGSYAAAAYLYIVDAGYAKGWARDFFTGTWYQDTNRLAAYLPIFATVLAALGMSELGRAAWKWLCTIAEERRQVQSLRHLAARVGAPTVWKVASGVVACAVVGVLIQLGPARDYIVHNKVFYERDTSESIVSSEEYKLFERLAEDVPDGSVIAVNPWNGGSLAYAFSGRRVLEYHQTHRKNADTRAIAEGLADAATKPGVCDAVRRQKVGYALDLGEQYLLNHPSSLLYPGLQDLEKSTSVKLVDQEGDAKLYRVTACK
ncbi:DUF6541 family protein [Pseudarthrobacter sp. NPDC092424]|uniref:DUF6541 family protein n=1 Tax=Pseudarthrobacter sp. NPDC092424 TaxID=3364415 RepID=UPI00380D8E3E